MDVLAPFRAFKNRKRRYRYNNLKKNHIRLLELQPGNREDPVVCRFQTVDLLAYDDIGAEASIQGFERYEAISYVWGDTCHTVQVDCKSHLQSK